METNHIEYLIEDQIAYLGFGKNETKSMTTLTEASLSELSEILDDVKKNKKIKAMILHSLKPDVFLAGMDISVIQGLNSELEAKEGCMKGQEIFNKIEDLKITTMSCINGPCLGGGLEMSLACDKIMVSDDEKTVLGLPEVMIGVLPGFGGTYRLVKKIGLIKALDLILTGKSVKAKKCIKLGLADFIVPKDKMKSLMKSYVFRKSNTAPSMKERLKESVKENFLTRKIIFQKAREQVLKTTKGHYPAPLKILSHLETAIGRNRKYYLEQEAQAFAELSQTYQCKSLLNVFHLQDAAKKKRNSDSKVEKSAVIGAGTMGGGIAWLMAKFNQSPLMKDISDEGLELGLKQASSIFSHSLKRRSITEDEFIRMQTSIRPTKTYQGFKKVDLCVEAIVENMDVKKKVLAEAEAYLAENALLTTNTSSLSVTEMASALKRPELFGGLHFFNPVNRMPLVEIVTHDKMSQETIDKLYNWCLAVKKVPVVVKDGPGFLVNRILAPFLNEACYLLSEGVSIQAMDSALVNFGMPMGPCRLMDEIGLDVCVHVSEVMSKGLGERLKASDNTKKALENDLLGKKNQKGFYLYDEAGKQLDVNKDIYAKIGVTQSIEMDERTIQMRLVLPMINEASYILSEQLVDSASLVDLGCIFGIGFPPFRGGPLRYADDEGLERILEALKRFSSQVSHDRYEPSSYLSDLVKNHKTFY